MRTMPVYRTNKSGTPGVHYLTREKAWRAMLYGNNRRICLGLFKDKEKAVEVLKRAHAKETS